MRHGSEGGRGGSGPRSGAAIGRSATGSGCGSVGRIIEPRHSHGRRCNVVVLKLREDRLSDRAPCTTNKDHQEPSYSHIPVSSPTLLSQNLTSDLSFPLPAATAPECSCRSPAPVGSSAPSRDSCAPHLGNPAGRLLHAGTRTA